MNTYWPKILSPFALALVGGSLLIAVVLNAGLIPGVAFKSPGDGITVYDALIDQLIFMSVVALFIERAIETYLVASGLHDDKVVDEATNTEFRVHPIAPYALTVGVVVSALVALAGVRLLDPVLDYEQVKCMGTWAGSSATSCGRFLIGTTDIVLTVGLLAGGSSLLHDIVQIIPTLTSRVTNFVGGTPMPKAPPKSKVLLNSLVELDAKRAALAAFSLSANKAIPQHTVRIDRSSGSTGTLYFTDDTQSLTFPCRWDNSNRISAATLTGCSRTMMATKQRPAIHMPGATLHGQPNNNIFIHRGRDETWSDGCFVLDDDDMEKLLAAIPNADAFNITVTVRDV